MSEFLAAAAAALGTPEALVKRAAEARATATGTTVDEVLQAWAGGGSVVGGPTVSPPSPSSAEDGEAEQTPAQSTPSEALPPPVAITPASAPPPIVPVGPYRPPVLVGAGDNPTRVLVGVIGLFLIVLLVGFVGASLPAENLGARTSNIPFSEDAQRGRENYLQLGCASCHTQMVRPVIADVGLGTVTLNDTNQVLGVRRFGPDLSNIGSRAEPQDMELMIRGGSGHPRHALSADDMASLVAYLVESATSGEDG